MGSTQQSAMLERGAARGPIDADVGGASLPTAWGLTPLAMHDRFWATQKVQVARPGGAPAATGPELYLLLPEGQMALFRLEEVVRRLNWLKPQALRIRIIENRPESYAESVVRDAEHRFVAISRGYRPGRTGVLRAAVTTSIDIARRWQAASSDRERWRLVSPASDPRNASMQLTGRVFGRGRTSDVAALVGELQRVWTRPQVVSSSVYEYAPGIFAHESAVISPTAELIGPLWIGAGVEIPAHSVVIGPGIMSDAPGHAAAATDAIPWRDLYLPRWPNTWQSGLLRRRIVKRGFDLAFSSLVLLATLPLYPLVMAAIWLEDGRPFFFVHVRQTLRGREFGCLKFRTMRKDAHTLQSQLAKANQADGPQFFIAEDPRLLRIGRFLRRAQIDELPQFINVLLGHMSVVGPRPSPDKENQFCPAWREARLSVRPGITGLWQVRRTRQPETDFQEWIRYDLEYVQRSSMSLDLWIVLQTILRILGR